MTCFLNALVHHHPVLLAQSVGRVLHPALRAAKSEEIRLQERCPKLVCPPVHRHSEVAMQEGAVTGKGDQVGERVV